MNIEEGNMPAPTPHREKLTALIDNGKLPPDDKPRVQAALERYHRWIEEMGAVNETGFDGVERLVVLLNEYKKYIDLELIFDSPNDFLYRSKGQLKIDNTIVEEFLPWLIRAPIITNLPDAFSTGPTNCYSAIYFESSLNHQLDGAGIHVRTKDQDFAMSRKLYVRASHSPEFTDAANVETFIAYVATEIKTNLDKTMFQEACATARDLRSAVPGARYFLMCEWLDMIPVSTAPTDIEEVLILRGAKRLASNVRKEYSAATNRRQCRENYALFLEHHPFRVDVFSRFIERIMALLNDAVPVERNVLENGFF